MKLTEEQDYKGWKCSALEHEVGEPADCGTVQEAFEAGKVAKLKELAATPDEEMVLTDEEIKAKLNDSFGDESYKRYIYQLGLDEQDAINLARFGAYRQAEKAAPIYAALKTRIEQLEAENERLKTPKRRIGKFETDRE